MISGEKSCWQHKLETFQPNGLNRPATLLKKRLQRRCFLVKFAKLLRTPFLQDTFGGCFRKNLMNSHFIAFENNEWCHFVVRICSPVFISFYCGCFVSFYFFLFCLIFCVDSTTFWS